MRATLTAANPRSRSQPRLPPPPLPELDEAALTVSVTELALEVPTALVHVKVYA